jgi:hypothetical protein
MSTKKVKNVLGAVALTICLVFIVEKLVEFGTWFGTTVAKAVVEEDEEGE